MDLPKDITNIILQFVSIKDLYFYGMTSKKALDQTGPQWFKRTQDTHRKKEFPELTLHTPIEWFRIYLKIQKDTINVLAYNLIDCLKRYPNKRVSKRYIKPQLFQSFFRLLYSNPALYMAKFFVPTRLEMEALMLSFNSHKEIGVVVESFFTKVYPGVYDHHFDLGLATLFDKTEETF
jgi:hypothetical protein